MSEDRSKKFNIQAGDFKVELSQCAKCMNNVGPYDCQIFTTKPAKYLNNEEDCPERMEKK